MCLLLSALVLCTACVFPGADAPTASVPLEVVGMADNARIIKHVFGQTRVPPAPQRVLALGEEELLLNLLDLGVKPVGANVNLLDRVALTTPEELAGIALFASAGDVTVETLAALEPDLIIGTVFFIEQAGYDMLSAIAPTVALASGDALQSYQDTALILGKESAAQQQIAAFEQRLQAEAARINASQRTLSLVSVYPGPSIGVWVDGPSPVPTLVRTMGITLRPDRAAVEPLGVRSGRAFISLEQLTLLDSDTLILLQSDTVEGETDAARDIADNLLWRQLPAVQTGRVVTLDRLGYPGVRGQRQLLEDLVTILEP
jgi:iron complex transport system substrate-binding protein